MMRAHRRHRRPQMFWVLYGVFAVSVSVGLLIIETAESPYQDGADFLFLILLAWFASVFLVLALILDGTRSLWRRFWSWRKRRAFEARFH